MLDLARASTLIGYQELVSKLGGDPEKILRRFHIEPSLLAHENHMIPYRSIIRVLENTANTLDCHDFGLRLAQVQGFNVVGPLALIGMNSPTVYQALQSMFDHIDFYSPAMSLNIDTKVDPLLPQITFDVTIADEPQTRQAVEWAVSLINSDIKTLTKGKFVAQHILFRHSSPLPMATYKKHFGTKAFFQQEVNAVVLKPEDLHYSLDNVDSYLKEIVTDYVRKTAEPHHLDLEHQIRLLVRQLLPSSAAGLGNIARHLCVHERTLQRRLKESALIFEEIVDSVRKDKALQLLKDTRLPMAQIAIQLGYSEQTSFNRSCHRWFEHSPSKVRKINR